MNYLYINNCRGFDRSLIPVASCNFLVGENSTGKSSFLSILRAASSFKFIFEPGFFLAGDDSQASYSDMVSAGSSDKSYFDVGFMFESKLPSSEKSSCGFTIQRYRDFDGKPQPSQVLHWSDGEMVHVRYGKGVAEYRISSTPASDGQEALKLFKSAISDMDREFKDFERLPKGFSGFVPPGIVLSVIASVESSKLGEGGRTYEFAPNFWREEITWGAPIRSRPERIYHGATKRYSSEGDHMPFVIKNKLKSAAFVSALRDFGKASGLFEIIATHTFGRGRNNPFEVLVRLNGVSYNLEHVGYGVSQVLPLVVDFLAAKDGRSFAVQQPEVHLHPRAQAALGTLLFQIASEKRHSFVIETHSDYLIDRFRLEIKKADKSPLSQVLYFSRSSKGNRVSPIVIESSGRYGSSQPASFRTFFINEESRMLSL